MTDICRLCASETPETNLINLNICTEKILQCCQINLEEEHLPQNVCNICVDNVEVKRKKKTSSEIFFFKFKFDFQKCWNFLENIKNVQETLRQAYIIKIEQENELVVQLEANPTIVVEQPIDCQEETVKSSKRKIKQPIKRQDDELIETDEKSWVFRCEESGNLLSFHTVIETNDVEKINENPENVEFFIPDDSEKHLIVESDVEDSGHGNISSESENESSQEEQLNLSDSEKNDDGTITESGVKKLNLETWESLDWFCSECGDRMKNYLDLKNHCSVQHQTNSKFVCSECSRGFTKYLTFINHVKKTHRPILKYCCDICSCYFWNLKQLRKHRAGHSVEGENYNCDICGKGFTNSRTLLSHAKSHQPNYSKNKHSCDVCFKKFGTKPNLMAHKRIHLGVREYTCEQCGKSFVQKGNLDNHMLTHEPTRPFNCDTCGKSFKTQLRLNNHKSVHSGLKAHQCDVCGRQFREKGTLREHHRIHTGAMPFTCEYCGKRFRFKGVLTTHRRQHTGERPYSCVDCNHHFTNWPNYNKHMKRRHGINTSVTVRSFQAIPPTGMPTNARQDIVVPTEHNTTGVLLKDDEEKCETSSQNVLVEVNEEKYDVECETAEILEGGNEVVVSQNLQQILNTQANQALFMTVGSPMLGYYNIQGVDVDLIQSQR